MTKIGRWYQRPISAVVRRMASVSAPRCDHWRPLATLRGRAWVGGPTPGVPPACAEQPQPPVVPQGPR